MVMICQKDKMTMTILSLYILFGRGRKGSTPIRSRRLKIRHRVSPLISIPPMWSRYWMHINICKSIYHITTMGRRGHDRMVVEFTTTYAISAYHHWCCEFESRSGRGVQHNVIKFVSDWRQVVESGVKHHQTNKQTRKHNNETVDFAIAWHLRK